MGFFDGIKKGASDLLAIGRQVAGMTLDAGAAALDGAKTLVTDPKKFAEDVAHCAAEFGRHASNSFSDGAKMIGEGWDEAWATGNPGMFLWKAAGGTVQMASLGAADAFKEHVRGVSTVARDELGNMTGYEIGEGCDALTRVILEANGQRVATLVNGDAEVKEAIAEGDIERANETFGQAIDAAVVKPVGQAAAVAAGVIGAGAAIAATGGAAIPAVVTAGVVAGGVGGTMLSMKGGKSQTDFDLANAADDVKDQVDAELAVLRAGGLSEEDAAKYAEIMTAYYQGAAYTGSGDQLGASQMGEGASNRDLKAWMLHAAGLDGKVEQALSVYEASVSGAAALPVPQEAPDAQDGGLAQALGNMSAEDQAAVTAFIASRQQGAGLAAAVEQQDPAAQPPGLPVPAAEQPGGTEHAEEPHDGHYDGMPAYA